MKICWDNLEKIRISNRGNFKINNNTYYEHDACFVCGNFYLGTIEELFCSKECASVIREINYNKAGKNNPHFGKNHSDVNKKIISEKIKLKYVLSENHPSWKGGYYTNNIPRYDLYAPKLEPYEQCKRNTTDPNILEVKCTYCGKWYVPTKISVVHRINGINDNDRCKFYCSEGCKVVCPLYRKKVGDLVKRDMISAGKILPDEINREVQPELRQLVLNRDNYICVKCGSDGPLHCHHIKAVAIDPIESADVDNCITLCVECHKEVHKLPGCEYKKLEYRNCI